jgi:hypothetical protein
LQTPTTWVLTIHVLNSWRSRMPLSLLHAAPDCLNNIIGCVIDHPSDLDKFDWNFQYDSQGGPHLREKNTSP